MANVENEGIMSTEGLATNRIRLHDGTVLNCQLNGTEYETKEKVDASIFTDENLASVTIDGVAHGSMKLVHSYPFNGGTRFALREYTEEEKTLAKMQSNLVYLATMSDVELF